MESLNQISATKVLCLSVSLELRLVLFTNSSGMHCFYARTKYETSVWPLGLYHLVQWKVPCMLVHIRIYRLMEHASKTVECIFFKCAHLDSSYSVRINTNIMDSWIRYWNLFWLKVSTVKSTVSMELCFKVDLTLLGKDSTFSQGNVYSENLFVHVP